MLSITLESEIFDFLRFKLSKINLLLEFLLLIIDSFLVIIFLTSILSIFSS